VVAGISEINDLGSQTPSTEKKNRGKWGVKDDKKGGGTTKEKTFSGRPGTSLSCPSDIRGAVQFLGEEAPVLNQPVRGRIFTSKKIAQTAGKGLREWS